MAIMRLPALDQKEPKASPTPIGLPAFRIWAASKHYPPLAFHFAFLGFARLSTFKAELLASCNRALFFVVSPAALLR